MEYHFVPPEERARNEKGEMLPWGYVYKDESRNPRRAPEESGPFGKRRNARYEHTRSRTRTGTPATKRENPNVAEFGRLFAAQQDEEKTRSNTMPKSASASNIESVRKQQQQQQQQSSSSSSSQQQPGQSQETEKVATECILYGYRSKDGEWKVLDKYERISQGFICEDYPRTDPTAATGFSQLLSGGDVVIRAGLSADANRKSKRYAGGYHWIKVTFDSTTAADRACFFSPQEIDGHLVFCELYHGRGPAEDVPIVAGSAEARRVQSKAPRTLSTSHSTAFLPASEKERHTLPRSFAFNNLSTVPATDSFDEGESLDSTPTASSTTATGFEPSTAASSSSSNMTLQQRSVPSITTTTTSPLLPREQQQQPKPDSDYMTHIPTVRRTKLRPLAEALPPQPTVTERVLRSIPILSWFTGDIVGDGPQLGDDGAFDYDKSNTYWRFWYMIDRIIGTDICGLKEESSEVKAAETAAEIASASAASTTDSPRQSHSPPYLSGSGSAGGQGQGPSRLPAPGPLFERDSRETSAIQYSGALMSGALGNSSERTRPFAWD
ncbi:uncharacterized protein BO97DRAFT_478889 [Aspergillus homomorphus CBS 101889]|uniref:Uncharacterized protein n=1 Tax=Aspergillus homomorphus (strain CBS 101889) TaxID=1450537 RepID=A0A395HU26_ASPHC|nr:hypothetical protein BO97DRAFT_478889 [Aspergillus homomorphus CBS 101889]RAL11046.1 hypothetical protein BO97DRAFT_478889 [Aspergillus homomorphus CBS 101889]